MAIRRWDPVTELVQLRDRLNRLFDQTLSRSGAESGEAAAEGWRPSIDLFEEPGRYVLRADLPGVAPGDYELEIDNGSLTLRGERRRDPGVPAESYLRVERSYGPFRAEVALPPSIDRAAIQAVHRGGVIEVVLPKKRRDDGPGRIEVASE